MLPARVHHYRLLLDPDAGAGTFSGMVSITLEPAPNAHDLRLDCEGLAIESASVGGAPVQWRVEPGKLVLVASSPLAPGAVVAQVRFRGMLEASPRGLYAGDGFIATQMQPSHARRVFPCFDDPQFRSVFDIAAWVPAGHTAVANAPVLDDSGEPGRRLVTFCSSTAIPTHLVALAIGPFKQLADAPLRLLTLGSPQRCEPALRIARAALSCYAGWLGCPFPFDKLDIVVLPHTGTAGMENTGAIFLREDEVALADDAEPVAIRARAALVAHEVAHQWFGGLVTPLGWDDLWLNEGFATWLAPKALATIAPTLTRDADEVLAMREALHADAGASARPLAGAANHVGAIEELFDALTYRKGAALLRMVEAWLGEDAMRRGLRVYLGRHANGTVSSADLWRALEEESGKPVAAVADSIAARPGAPRVAVEWAHDTLALEQSPESLLPVRLRVAFDDGTEDVVNMLLDRQRAEVKLRSGIRWAIGDAGAVGYYRCSYPGAQPPIAPLSPSEAVALVEDAWIALWAAEIDLVAYLAIAGEALAAGAALPSLRRQLGELRELLASGPRMQTYNGWVRATSGDSPSEEFAGLLADLDAPGELAPGALAGRLALLHEPANRIATVEALLADPATRNACWELLKERWDEFGVSSVGFGGRGVIAGLAAFSDHAAEADVARFFANREVPGARWTLQASLARIAGRRQFRDNQQFAMDAFLMRLGAPAGPAPDRVRVEHAFLAALASGLRGALVQRSLTDRFGLQAPPWMHTVENLRRALAGAERQLALLHRGQPVVKPGDIELSRTVRDDLLAAADELEARLATDAAPAAQLTIAATVARAGAMQDRALQAAVVFAGLFDTVNAPDVRREFLRSRKSLEPAHAFIAGVLDGTLDATQGAKVREMGTGAAGLLRRQALLLQAP